MHSNLTLCACGCGQSLEATDARGRLRRFIHGHNPQLTLEQRFWNGVSKSDEGCWLWKYRINEWGYGCIDVRHPARKLLAHRVSWELHNGAIPYGLSVLHKCNTPRCVRPDHLYLGNHYQNMQDRKAAGHYGGPYNRGSAEERP